MVGESNLVGGDCCLLFAMIVFCFFFFGGGGGWRLWNYRAEDRVLHVSDDNFDKFSARLHSTFGRASDSRSRGPGFDTWSSHLLSFPLFKEQLSVSGISIRVHTRQGNVREI